MKNKIRTLFSVFFALFLLSVSYAQGTNASSAASNSEQTAGKAASSKEYGKPTTYEKTILQFESEDTTQPPPQNAIVCYGSSSMRGWHKTIKEDLAPLTLIPRGFGGSTMNEALYYADRMVIKYKPRAVLLYEGDNDIAQGISPEKIKDTFLALVAKIHAALPETRIYVLSIKPCRSRWHLWEKTKEANALLEKECEKDKRLTYIDVASKMFNADGELNESIFLGDKLHMKREGYLIWRDVVRPVLLKNEEKYERNSEGKSEQKHESKPQFGKSSQTKWGD